MDNDEIRIQPWYTKVLVGWCGFIVLILLIILPMIIFSSLNPTSTINIITGGTISIGVQLGSFNSFEIFKTYHFNESPKPIDEKTRLIYNLDRIPTILYSDPSQLQ